MIGRSVLCASLAFSAAVAGARTFLTTVLSEPVWVVQPASDANTELTVRKGEWVTKTPMTPGAVARLSADARDQQGRVIALGGDELFLRMVNQDQAFCTYSSRKPGQTIGKVGSAVTDPCFLDRNADGIFEASLRVRMLPPATIFSIAPVHEKEEPIAPAVYEKVEAGETKHAYHLGVRFSGIGLGGQPVFTVAFGAGEGAGMSVPTSYEPARNAKIELLGASYTILSREKDVIRVRVDRAIPTQAFMLQNRAA